MPGYIFREIPYHFMRVSVPVTIYGIFLSLAGETAPVKGRSHRVSVVYLCNNTSGREQGG
jgi:hypothetical protein